MNILQNDFTTYKAGKIVVYFFFSNLCISFIYALFWGKYNGDFGDDVLLNPIFLVLNLIISTIPFFSVFVFYRYFKFKFKAKKIVTINKYAFEWIVYFLLLWHISTTLIFGVNKMGSDAYSAPSSFMPIIQIMNRFNPQIIAPLFILISNNKNKIILIIFGLIILSIARASLGMIFILSMFLFVKYYLQILFFIKKHFLLFFIVIFLFIPTSIKLLYELRSTLRDTVKTSDTNVSKVFLNQFLGRLSSFSNSAMIIQDAPYFFIEAQYLDDYFFQKTAISVIIGQKYKPKTSPSEILVKYANPYAENSQYMCGTQGTLIISFYKSIKLLVINTISYILLTYLIFYFAKILKTEYNMEFALINLVMCAMSGAPNEYSFFLFTIVILVFIFSLTNSIKIILQGKLQ